MLNESRRKKNIKVFFWYFLCLSFRKISKKKKGYLYDIVVITKERHPLFQMVWVTTEFFNNSVEEINHCFRGNLMLHYWVDFKASVPFFYTLDISANVFFYFQIKQPSCLRERYRLGPSFFLPYLHCRRWSPGTYLVKKYHSLFLCFISFKVSAIIHISWLRERKKNWLLWPTWLFVVIFDFTTFYMVRICLRNRYH